MNDSPLLHDDVSTRAGSSAPVATLLDVPPGDSSSVAGAGHGEAPQATRRASTKQTDSQLRVAAQGHLDARRQRLDAYEASLQASLDRATSDSQAARLEGQLTLLRRHIGASTRSRLPGSTGDAVADVTGAANARALSSLRRAPAATRVEAPSIEEVAV